MKKLFSSILTAALLVTPIAGGTALAAERTVDSYFMEDLYDHWGFEELDDLVNAEIFKGAPTSTGEYLFSPKKSITRAEFAAVVVRSLGLEATGTGTTFTDIPENHSLKTEIQIASDHGIVNGVAEGEFAPNSPILREQVAAIVVRAFEDTIDFSTGTAKTFSDLPAGHWASEDIAKASGIELVKGIDATNFGLGRQANRGEAGVLLHRALQSEQVNLPTDEELTTLIVNGETEAFAKITNGDKAGLLVHLENHYTGYQKAHLLEMADYTFEEGTTQSIEFVGTPILTVLSKSDRFATVELVGSVNVSYDDGTTSFNTEIPYESIYNLKKVDGKWKVYFEDSLQQDYQMEW
ncbi:S-layer homology domain-containing protein [Halalkalibacter urbisdiaboli]|uniref:S-layer homology domain-containing protein n=1 Tax=Halalkalibacter urbisdiaboli TaxID=1960589 RepID=UPI0013FD7D9E|nr:S-layer homology domain-containing protein [Halalkalibacter urbisdiaboli]